MATRDEVLDELGLTPRWRLRVPVAAAAGETTSAPAAATSAARNQDAVPRLERIAALTWDDFAADVARCDACGLCKSRNKTVPGVGDVAAEWMFVGEAPGAEEDARGEPFVGQAGRLLDSMLGALGMKRDPQCLHRQRAEVPATEQPHAGARRGRRLPALPRAADRPDPAQADRRARQERGVELLLGTDATIASLRGRLHDYRGVPLS